MWAPSQDATASDPRAISAGQDETKPTQQNGTATSRNQQDAAKPARSPSPAQRGVPVADAGVASTSEEKRDAYGGQAPAASAAAGKARSRQEDESWARGAHQSRGRTQPAAAAVALGAHGHAVTAANHHLPDYYRSSSKHHTATAAGRHPAWLSSSSSSSRPRNPPAEAVDPRFANRSSRRQRWEYLESAKRWLPGKGTVIYWKDWRYYLHDPIHMGMNGHIHHCYRSKVPRTREEMEYVRRNGAPVEHVAAKVVPNTPAFAREIVILRALQGCENITKLFDVLESERTLISVLELAQADVYNFFVGRAAARHGWSLSKPANREHFARMVVTDVVQGLIQMHEHSYLHCDLKSLNVLLFVYSTHHAQRTRSGVYIKGKLTDFGHSFHGKIRIAEKLFPNGMARVGTAGHVAPELFVEGTPCGPKIDIWSLGVVLFSMLVPGRLLFGEYTDLDSLKKAYKRLNEMNPFSRDRPSWWSSFERLSPEARDLILWLTRFEPHERPNEEAILKHPWFLIARGDFKPGGYRPKLPYVDRLCPNSIAQE